MNCWKVIYS